MGGDPGIGTPSWGRLRPPQRPPARTGPCRYGVCSLYRSRNPNRDGLDEKATAPANRLASAAAPPSLPSPRRGGSPPQRRGGGSPPPERPGEPPPEQPPFPPDMLVRGGGGGEAAHQGVRDEP